MTALDLIALVRDRGLSLKVIDANLRLGGPRVAPGC